MGHPVKTTPHEKRETDQFEKLAKEITGKTVVVYGPSWSGKTTLVLHLSKYLGKVLYLDSDQNYPVQETARKLGVDIIYKTCKSFEQAVYYMINTTADTVVVDSLSGLVANLVSKLGAGNPRLALFNAQEQEKLIKTCKNFRTCIIVTHTGADFRTGGERIRINQALLRYIDVIIRVGIENGRRVVRINKRTPVETPEFVFESL